MLSQAVQSLQELHLYIASMTRKTSQHAKAKREATPHLTVLRAPEESLGHPYVRLDELLREMDSEIRCLAREEIDVQFGYLTGQSVAAIALPARGGAGPDPPSCDRRL